MDGSPYGINRKTYIRQHLHLIIKSCRVIATSEKLPRSGTGDRHVPRRGSVMFEIMLTSALVRQAAVLISHFAEKIDRPLADEYPLFNAKTLASVHVDIKAENVGVFLGQGGR
jgi:hypothetical protein